MMRRLSPTGQDDTWQFARAFRELADLDTLLVSSGVYRISGPLTCLDKRLIIHGDGAVLRTNISSGTALTVGFSPGNSAAAGQGGANWTIRGLGLTFGGTGGTYMNNAVTAMQVQNVYGGIFDNIHIDGFNVGFSLAGLGVGCTANRVGLGSMQNNQTHCVCLADSTGYCTENTFEGGNWGWGPIGQNKAGVCISSTSGNCGANRWRDVSLQGWPDVSWAVLASCKYMHLLDCRYETTNNSVVAIVLPTSTYNCAVIGCTNPNVSINDQSGGANGHVFLPNWH